MAAVLLEVAVGEAAACTRQRERSCLCELLHTHTHAWAFVKSLFVLWSYHFHGSFVNHARSLVGAGKTYFRKHKRKRNTITCATLTPSKKVKTKRKPKQKHHETSKRLANEVNKDVCMNKSLLCLFVKLIDRGNESDALELQHSCYLWCLTVLCLALDHDGL